MSYERISGLGAVESCPANQRLVRNLTAGTSRCVPLCSSYNCPSGKRKETLTAYSAGAAQIATTTSRRQSMTSRGCVRVPSTDCMPDSQMINSAGVETYCCPDPDAQWRVQHELELTRRRANITSIPAGSTCGDGKTTKSHQTYSCPPSMSCQAELGMPSGCVATGRWYDEYNSEYCCPAQNNVVTPPDGSGDAAILEEMQRRRAAEQAAISQRQVSQNNTLIILGIGVLGLGLFIILRKK